MGIDDMAKFFNASIKTAADGKLQDGGGLVLVKVGGAGRWVSRYSFPGRCREVVLGTWPRVFLSNARNPRGKWASVPASGN